MNKRTYWFACCKTRLGTVLMAAGDKGLAAVVLGDSEERLRRDLARTFPASELIEDTAAVAGMLPKVVSAVNALDADLEVPLDMQDSDIELVVWQALRQILGRETRSYGQAAKSLPIVATAHEVGAAYEVSILAVVVPCHRVVRADGSISGYPWGLSRKRHLIAMERAA